jgi:CheY-like chemotaxis protein
MDKKAYTVLIVDDSDDDRFFLRGVLQHFPRFTVVGEVADGEEAMAYLCGLAAYGERGKFPLPDLMLLDLKMPRKNGFEVLEWLRSKSFPAMTVIVLSGSPLAEDIGASLALGAHGFWTKTAIGEKQNAIIEEIEAILDRRWRSQA